MTSVFTHTRARTLPGFWQYESTYREQPRVHFTRDVMVSLGGCPTAGAALGSPDRSWSTFRRHVDLLQPEFTVLPLMVVSARVIVVSLARKEGTACKTYVTQWWLLHT